MLFKIILLFMLAMFLVAIVGRVLFPSALPPVLRKRKGTPRCGRCGRYLIGRGGCDCGGRAK